MFLEVEQNPNCGASVFLRFKALGQARQLRQVRSYEHSARGEWCDVVGWTDDDSRPVCPAMARPVEESGHGTAYVVFGGPWGLRLKRAGAREDWSLNSPRQWGEPYLLLTDARDLRMADVT